jgi:hypothetical protein
MRLWVPMTTYNNCLGPLRLDTPLKRMDKGLIFGMQADARCAYD